MRQYQNFIVGSALLLAAGPALAAKEPAVELIRCEKSYGSVAVVEGDTQGWAQYGLGSPRSLITALATESGCFTVHNPASGTPATFLLNVIAGSKEEVDQGVNMAKTAAMEGLVRSGAAGSLLGSVPMGGALLGAFSGFGGKKKIVAAGIRMISPMNGQTMVAGSGEVKASTLSFGNAAGVPMAGWMAGAQASGYGGSKDGKMLVEAFVKAFNAVVAQGSALQTVTAGG